MYTEGSLSLHNNGNVNIVHVYPIRIQEEKTGEKASEATFVRLNGIYPPIEKMDASLSALKCCEKLTLSTNNIEKIGNLNGLKNLKILALGRNSIKVLFGLESLGDTLEQLWLSYNNIEKLKGIQCLRKVKILYLANNIVKDWTEFNRLSDLPCLEDLLFVGNPLEENNPEIYRDEVTRRLPKLKKLDGIPLVRDSEDD